MNIVHLACVAPPQTGGIGRVAYEEVRRLKQRGHEVVLFAPSGPDLEPMDLVDRPATWNVFGNTGFLSPAKLNRRVKQADIIHLHFPFYGASEEILFLKWIGSVKKLVMTLHMDARPTDIAGKILDFHRFAFQPFELAQANALLVSSKDYAAHSSYARYINDTRLHELPFGVDLDRFSPRSVDRMSFGIPADAQVVGFVGGMDRPHAFKGVDILLQAVARCSAKTHVLLAGEGELRPEFEALATRLGIADRCHFLGRVSDEQLPNVYRACDVFAFPSISSAEAFGLVALEAQACGIPVIASDLPGVRTVVRNQETGFLTPPSDIEELAAHLRLLLENADMRQSFGHAARAHAEQHFSWERHMTELERIYRAL